MGNKKSARPGPAENPQAADSADAARAGNDFPDVYILFLRLHCAGYSCSAPELSGVSAAAGSDGASDGSGVSAGSPLATESNVVSTWNS